MKKKLMIVVIAVITVGMIVLSLCTEWTGTINYGGTVWGRKICSLADNICARCTSDREKAERLYRWIIEHMEYDEDFETQYQYFDAEKTLSTKKGVCFDIANLYAAFCRSQNVQCKVIDGYRRTAPDELHTWNRVYFDGIWWNLDPSFDTARYAEGKSLYGFCKVGNECDLPDEEYVITRIY